MKRPERKLVLESGEEFIGVGFGSAAPKVCEVVFNTSVVGYQEIISDPCYAGKLVVMTYPLIGNYGITNEDYESKSPMLGGLIVRECCDTPSNFRAAKPLKKSWKSTASPVSAASTPVCSLKLSARAKSRWVLLSIPPCQEMKRCN